MDWMLEITNAVGILEMSTSERSHHHLHGNHPPAPFWGENSSCSTAHNQEKCKSVGSGKLRIHFKLLRG